jgi:hypothetical protein
MYSWKGKVPTKVTTKIIHALTGMMGKSARMVVKKKKAVCRNRLLE